jgi:hypothetical protein
MTDNETQQELAELRREVAALSEARAARTVPDPPEEPPATEGSGTENEIDLSAQLEELVRLANAELRDNPIVAGAAIFVAGLLVGRLLR